KQSTPPGCRRAEKQFLDHDRRASTTSLPARLSARPAARLGARLGVSFGDEYSSDHALGSRCQISPSPKLNHRVVVTFSWVKTWTPSLPCMCKSPKKDSFHPLNGNQAIEAGTPMLIPTIPH